MSKDIKTLKTKNVFLDTQAFMQQAFKFNNPTLSRISELSSSGKITLVVTEVVKREVASKILEKVSVLNNNKNSLLKNLSILEEFAPKELTEILNKTKDEDIIFLANYRWKKYLEESKAVVLDPNNICNNNLLSHYFDGTYPFSQGKKKNEFPDAISLLTLEEWLSKNDESIYIISDDSDLKGFSEKRDNFISISKIVEFLDLYNRVEERLTTVIHRYLQEDESWIIEQLTSEFLNCGFDYSDNWEAEVENVEVNNLKIIEQDVIEIENTKVIVNIKVSISWSADVSGPNYDTAMWDSEDKEYYFIEDFNINVESDAIYDATVDFTVDLDEGEFSSIEYVEFENGGNITIYQEDEFR